MRIINGWGDYIIKAKCKSPYLASRAQVHHILVCGEEKNLDNASSNNGRKETATNQIIFAVNERAI